MLTKAIVKLTSDPIRSLAQGMGLDAPALSQIKRNAEYRCLSLGLLGQDDTAVRDLIARIEDYLSAK